MPDPRTLQPQHWHRDSALERLDGDERLLEEMIALLLEEIPRRLEELGQALARADVTGVRAAAHSLKGQLSYLDAGGVIAAVDQVTAAARDGDLTLAAKQMDELERLSAELERELRARPSSPATPAVPEC